MTAAVSVHDRSVPDRKLTVSVHDITVPVHDITVSVCDLSVCPCLLLQGTLRHGARATPSC